MRAAALCGLLFAAAAHPQEPQPGVEHDSWRQIALAQVAGTDCVEVVSARHTIRVSLADLRAMAVDAGRIMGAAAEPRLKRIFEGRAQELLGRFAGVPAGAGCLQALAEGDDRYVIAELLKAGRAGVRREGAPAASIWMRHLGQRAGTKGHGEILFYAERGGEPFFVVSWWVS